MGGIDQRRGREGDRRVREERREEWEGKEEYSIRYNNSNIQYNT